MVSRVSGIVDMRPVRLGLVFRPTLDLVLQASFLATSAWGGASFPWVSPDDESFALDLALALDTDVLYALDDSEESQRLARRPGFTWRGYQGPFDSVDSTLHERLLGPEWLLDGSYTHLVLPEWEEDDSLAHLFAVWFGSLAYCNEPSPSRAPFLERAEPVRLESGQDVPPTSSWTTPIQLTMMGVRCHVMPRSVGFALVDPTSAVDLALFWNLRARGYRVFPWPCIDGNRLTAVASDWIEALASSDDLPRFRRASGEFTDPAVTFWSTVEPEDIQVPDDLKGIVDGWEIHVSGPGDLPWGWRGFHPLSTDFTRFYDLTLPRGDWAVSIPLPRDRPGGRRLDGPAEGTVAVDVTVTSQSGLPAGATFAVPKIRRLANVMSPFPSPVESFRRPTGEGQAVGVSVNADEVSLGLTPTLGIFEELLSSRGWRVGQSDNGRFASRLIELLGGPESQAANEPAVRHVLDDASRTPAGHPMQRLRQTAHDHMGEWPDGLQKSMGRDRTYPETVVRYLLARKALKPFLSVKCPACSLTAQVTPEDLATDFQCEMCSERTPLGLVLSLGGAAWTYRLAGNVPEQRLREALPMMAVVSLLSSRRTTLPASVPHVLGLEVKRAHQAIEVDLALVLSDEQPVIVLGEAKSYRDSIEASDLANLGVLQQGLIEEGVPTLLCVATLRENLQPEETAAIRQWCERGTWLSLGRRTRVPNVPIVLTGMDLSLPSDNDQHPSQWRDSSRSIPGLAMESCRRNLGLTDVSRLKGQQDSYALHWS